MSDPTALPFELAGYPATILQGQFQGTLPYLLVPDGKSQALEVVAFSFPAVPKRVSRSPVLDLSTVRAMQIVGNTMHLFSYYAKHMAWEHTLSPFDISDPCHVHPVKPVELGRVSPV